MVDLLNNFLNPLKLFLGVESDFTKSLQLRIEGEREKDKQRSSYGESGERWAERDEAKVFAKRQRYKKLSMHATSPKSLAPVIHAFRKSCIHTSYIA
jgi:hypothetical protein